MLKTPKDQNEGIKTINSLFKHLLSFFCFTFVTVLL